jgi:hypothetical protein
MNPRNLESLPCVAFRLERDARLVSEAQAEFFRNRGLSRDVVAAWPDASRDTLNRSWSVSQEKARLGVALACTHDLPCADSGLDSWRYPSPYGGWIMIGARDNVDALNEASRSIYGAPDPEKLERWSWTARAYVASA